MHHIGEKNDQIPDWDAENCRWTCNTKNCDAASSKPDWKDPNICACGCIKENHINSTPAQTPDWDEDSCSWTCKT